MSRYYLAVDIGASSGRHMLAHMEDGKIILEEIYRFPNGMKEVNGHKVWDIKGLFEEIIAGMKKCKEMGKLPHYMAIDTWAVDFVLLDQNDRILGNAVAYRDERTAGMDARVSAIISQEDLYRRTGIQKQIFNTIYQLMAVKTQEPQMLAQSKSMLMIPDYFHYLLTGKKVQEYTNATTTQLVNPDAKDWDYELIECLGYPKEIFLPIHQPGTVLGGLTEAVRDMVGYDCTVILPATHDTGSAVVAVPSNDDDTLYISSGTWSLMGIEHESAVCSEESRCANFTNEGGYDYRFRYLKNIMGLWMIQSVKKEIGKDLTFGEICDLASQCTIPSIVDANDARFLAPEHMAKEVQAACRESGQQIPEGIAEIAAVIYNSLAVCYDRTAKEIEALTHKSYDKIHVIGGGANAQYLNELTARYTDKTVLAGPAEATAIGNLTAQMLADGVFADLKEARKCIFHSFEIKEYHNS